MREQTSCQSLGMLFSRYHSQTEWVWSGRWGWQAGHAHSWWWRLTGSADKTFHSRNTPTLSVCPKEKSCYMKNPCWPSGGASGLRLADCGHFNSYIKGTKEEGTSLLDTKHEGFKPSSVCDCSSPLLQGRGLCGEPFSPPRCGTPEETLTLTWKRSGTCAMPVIKNMLNTGSEHNISAWSKLIPVLKGTDPLSSESWVSCCMCGVQYSHKSCFYLWFLKDVHLDKRAQTRALVWIRLTEVVLTSFAHFPLQLNPTDPSEAETSDGIQIYGWHLLLLSSLQYLHVRDVRVLTPLHGLKWMHRNLCCLLATLI